MKRDIETFLGKIMVLGSRGMVGGALVRLLANVPNLAKIHLVDRGSVDLMDYGQTAAAIAEISPDWVIVAAAKVGGIAANEKYPAEFIYNNLCIQNNAIEGARQAGVEKLIFLGSSCIYPKFAANPIKENALLSGSLEPTNEPYAIAKIAGIVLCDACNRQYNLDYRSLMPCNLFGPGDNYHQTNSHVIPALIRKFHEAKINKVDEVTIWGDGSALREFLYVDDLCSAVIHCMSMSEKSFRDIVPAGSKHINVGSGIEISVGELAKEVGDVVGWQGNILFDKNMPNGTPRKLLDSSALEGSGWTNVITLKEGLRRSYADFLSRYQFRSYP